MLFWTLRVKTERADSTESALFSFDLVSTFLCDGRDETEAGGGVQPVSDCSKDPPIVLIREGENETPSHPGRGFLF